MKTLKNHVILYDAECPMCKVYTNVFIKSGMLDVAGRVAYQQMPETVCPFVDKQRAVNEIALVNTQTGEVRYGVHSVFKVIANSFPIFKPLFSFGPFIWLMSKVYAFISYNRRVIILADITDAKGLQPSFRLSYRMAYLVFTWALTGYILTAYARLLTGFVPIGNSYREYLICGGQIMFQGIIVSLYVPAKRWEYLGNMMTISFAGALFLTPMLFITVLPEIIYLFYFLAVAGLMLLEHIRRSKLLHLDWYLSVTWVVYRLIVLLIILKLK
jgi:hypothetical protein